MSAWGNPRALQHFRCVEFRVSSTRPEIELDYVFELGPVFTERLIFSGGQVPSNPQHFAALERAASLLHVAAGVSYYKASAAPKIEISGAVWSRARERFFRDFYELGLAEFSYRNQQAVKPEFCAGDLAELPRSGGRLPHAVVVPLGGGKDSLVTCDLLDRVACAYQTVAVGGSPVIQSVAGLVGKSHIRIDRQLAPELAALNARGALNGHVPITGILSLVLICGAWYYGYNTIVMSNESSADEPTLLDDAMGAVNHQYTKSLQYEQALQDLLEAEFETSARPAYFSLLRPLNEVTIARIFAFLEGFHGAFTSCNRNFVQGDKPEVPTWCCDCPKCRFVFLALAPFIRRERLTEIFGLDLLNDPRQLPGYRALLGLGDHKPFECVGTVRESLSVMRHLVERADWQGAAVIAELSATLSGMAIPGLRSLLKERGSHRIPTEFQDAIDAVDRA